MIWQNSVMRAFAVRSIGATASLGYGLLLANVLTPDAMGKFTIALSVAIIASTISKFGLDAYLMRNAASRPQESYRVTVYCLSLAGFIGSLVWGGCTWAGLEFYESANTAFVVLLLGIPFLAMIYVLTGLLKSGNLPATAVFLETGCWQTLLCLCAIVMQLFGYDSLLLVAICFSTGLALIFVISFFLSWHHVLGRKNLNQEVRSGMTCDYGELTAMAGLTASSVIMRWSDAIWLAWWLDSQEIAVYMICTRLAGGISFIDNAVNAIAAPRFARFFASGKTSTLRRELRRACTISGIWGTVGAIMVMLIGPFILHGLGSPYSEASEILLFATLAIAIQVAWVPIGHFATMTGRASVHFKSTAIALVVQQLAFLLFIPHFGVMAALFGFALSRILSFMITFGVLRHRSALLIDQ
ncbi:MAG: oligosaccharide flippase family protein [Gammaproteobacteria bacterium]|nr:oligosaccharide flippase family protein [Gammaproteobacteria bacterium]